MGCPFFLTSDGRKFSSPVSSSAASPCGCASSLAVRPSSGWLGRRGLRRSDTSCGSGSSAVAEFIPKGQHEFGVTLHLGDLKGVHQLTE